VVQHLADARQAVPTDLADRGRLIDLWQQVARLHGAGVSHHALVLENVLVDDSGVWLVDFDDAETAAEPRELARDVAELLVETGIAAGPDEAVDAAVASLGNGPVAAALPFLQPLALSWTTRRRLRDQGSLLQELRQRVRDRTGAPEVELERLERISPKTLIILLASSLAFYTLLPQLARIGDTADAFETAELEWLVVLLLGSAVTYVFATISFVGSVADDVAFFPALRSRLASAFTALVGPASSGGLAFSIRFLERSGVSVAEATSSVALNTVGGLLVHVVLMVGFFVWTGRSGVGGFSIPDANTILLVASLVIFVIGLLIMVRPLRQRIVLPALRSARTGVRSVVQVFRSPGRVIALFGGAAGLTLTYVVCLTAAIEAFGGSLTFPQIGAAYLGAMVIATFAPTPGGIGAVEAALIAALTGFGLDDGIAVSSVLTFRLATFWLPILPGWLVFTWMQRAGEM
jgi:undecaprenyl-diphosphatase